MLHLEFLFVVLGYQLLVQNVVVQILLKNLLEVSVPQISSMHAKGVELRVILTNRQKLGTLDVEHLNLVSTQFGDLGSFKLLGYEVILGLLLEEDVEVAVPATLTQSYHIDADFLTLLVSVGAHQPRAALHDEEQVI